LRWFNERVGNLAIDSYFPFCISCVSHALVTVLLHRTILTLESSDDLLITVAARKGELLLAIAVPVQIKGRRCSASEVDRVIRERFTSRWSRRLLRATISHRSSCVHYRRLRFVCGSNALVCYRIGAMERACNLPEL